MELVKDIYFNTDKLIENTKVKVSYTGNFYQGNNEKVFIHYGYGESWNNINEAEMVKTDLGYQTELELVGGNTLNFCFKNQNNEWDNNFGKNYIFNIEKASSNELEKTTFGIEQNSGVIENPVIGTPDSVDNFNIIPPVLDSQVTKNNAAQVAQNLDILVTPDTQVSKNEFIDVPVEKVSPIKTDIINSTNTVNQYAKYGEVTTNAIAVVNTGFKKTIVWSRKFKDDVFKFFAYVPKFISGNYKRFIDNKKQQ